MSITSVLIGQSIHVVNNAGDAAPEHFETLADAYAAAIDGDILLIHGSITPYSFGTDMAKRLTIYGPGFNLSSYPDTLVTNVNTVKIEPLTIIDGAEGSAFFGLVLGTLKLDTDDIFFKGCRFVTSADSNTSDFKYNILMEGCYVGIDLKLGNTCQVNMKNSVMGKIETFPSSNMPGFTIDHSVVNFQRIYNSNISNSYSDFFGGIAYSNTNVDHSIFETGAPVTCTACIENIACADMYEDCGGAVDIELKYLNLKAGSPGLNAASDGTDIGITGGIEPYKKSGIPAAPYINELTVPFTPDTNTMEVYIKATAEQ